MDAAAAHWWESIQQRRFLVQRCSRCELLQHPPGPWCRNCRSAAALEWVPHSGSGRLVSFTEIFRTTYPELRSEVPYWIAMIELVPGAVLVSNLVLPDGGADGARPRIGDPVRLSYRERGGRTLPVFELHERDGGR